MNNEQDLLKAKPELPEVAGKPEEKDLPDPLATPEIPSPKWSGGPIATALVVSAIVIICYFLFGPR